jgi:DNA-directed RNA polymerase-5 subunit 1
VVSTDGSRADFSYFKCLENFVRKSFKEDADTFCMKYLRPRRRQAPPPDGGAAPGIPAEAPPSAAVETELGTPAPPEVPLSAAAETAQMTPASTAEAQQETLDSPASALGETPKPDSTGGAGILEKQPDPTPQASPDNGGILGKGPDSTTTSTNR